MNKLFHFCDRMKQSRRTTSRVPCRRSTTGPRYKKDGDDLFDHYRHMLESLRNEKGLLGLIFNESQNKFQDSSKLRRQLFTNRQTCILRSLGIIHLLAVTIQAV